MINVFYCSGWLPSLQAATMFEASVLPRVAALSFPLSLHAHGAILHLLFSSV